MTNYLKLVFHLGETMFMDLGQVTDFDIFIIIDERGLMLTLYGLEMRMLSACTYILY